MQHIIPKTIDKPFIKDISYRKPSDHNQWNEKFKKKFPNSTFSKDIYKSEVRNLALKLNPEESLKNESLGEEDSLNLYNSLNKGKSNKKKHKLKGKISHSKAKYET